ncbi:hypothetical protein DPMN_051323 [Dreissena polymorpha]|uniref:Uncharacterized protein n=1 Tax=Dreissena polymorpha TaxID=45954 RepID=A0A9D4CHN2_DREPO|nr:hypothetical protein DPMN_051323 [Dreissena polymorpha]
MEPDVSDQAYPSASRVILGASRLKDTESIPVHAPHVAVSTAGNSTVSSYVGM